MPDITRNVPRRRSTLARRWPIDPPPRPKKAPEPKPPAAPETSEVTDHDGNVIATFEDQAPANPGLRLLDAPEGVLLRDLRAFVGNTALTAGEAVVKGWSNDDGTLTRVALVEPPSPERPDVTVHIDTTTTAATDDPELLRRGLMETFNRQGRSVPGREA